LKPIHFLIHSNIFISLAAVSLSIATEAQLGLTPHLQVYLALIFLATLFDYNLHRFIAVTNKPEAIYDEKLRWATSHISLIKVMLVFALAGLVVTFFFVRIESLCVLLPLAMVSFLYSYAVKLQHQSQLLMIPGIKTIAIAFVWTASTVLLPVLQSGYNYKSEVVPILFAERFAFIFAIAIPFDIRDLRADALAGIRTIPIVVGEKLARLVSNFALIVSAALASVQYITTEKSLILAAYLFSVVLTIIFINLRKIRSHPLYYHGILDGCIMIHGLLIILSFYFEN